MRRSDFLKILGLGSAAAWAGVRATAQEKMYRKHIWTGVVDGLKDIQIRQNMRMSNRRFTGAYEKSIVNKML